MNFRYTKPAKEARQPQKAGTLKIEAITIVLSDASVITVARTAHCYRATIRKPGTEEECDISTPLPEMGVAVSQFLDSVPLEANARSTLFTLFNLESLASSS